MAACHENVSSGSAARMPDPSPPSPCRTRASGYALVDAYVLGTASKNDRTAPPTSIDALVTTIVGGGTGGGAGGDSASLGGRGSFDRPSTGAPSAAWGGTLCSLLETDSIDPLPRSLAFSLAHAAPRTRVAIATQPKRVRMPMGKHILRRRTGSGTTVKHVAA
jgi:hypothetical protein